MMEKIKKIPPVLIISLAIILSAIIFSQTSIYIKNIGGAEANGQVSNTISVTGDGQISVKPDMVVLSISVQETASTSQQALTKLNSKIDSVLDILKNNKIDDSDITTSNLSIYTEYDYSGSTRRIVGQKASESLEIKIKDIDEQATKATKIIDQLSGVDNLQIDSISFDIENKTEFFSQARELAFNKAKQKAEELAELSKVKLTQPISITDNTIDVSSITPVYSNINQIKALSVSEDTAGGGQISTGEMDISANVSILWGIE